jgi:hypothetical protein
MSKPPWLRDVREFCRQQRIEIVGWGDNAIVVVAKSDEAATQIAEQFSSLGFTAVKDDSDAEAGLLTLTRNPAQ